MKIVNASSGGVNSICIKNYYRKHVFPDYGIKQYTFLLNKWYYLRILLQVHIRMVTGQYMYS